MRWFFIQSSLWVLLNHDRSSCNLLTFPPSKLKAPLTQFLYTTSLIRDWLLLLVNRRVVSLEYILLTRLAKHTHLARSNSRCTLIRIYTRGCLSCASTSMLLMHYESTTMTFYPSSPYLHRALRNSSITFKTYDRSFSHIRWWRFSLPFLRFDPVCDLLRIILWCGIIGLANLIELILAWYIQHIGETSRLRLLISCWLLILYRNAHCCLGNLRWLQAFGCKCLWYTTNISDF